MMISQITEAEFDEEDLVMVHLHSPGLEMARVASSKPDDSWTNPTGVPKARRPADGKIAEAQYVVSGLRAMIKAEVERQLNEHKKTVTPDSLDEPKRRGRPKGSKNKPAEAATSE